MARKFNPVVAPQITNTVRIGEQLVRWFQGERPPADYIEVVPDSIKPVDAKFHLYKALVRTDLYIGGVKSHISNIRFKIDQRDNVIGNSVTFS
jgi:hypothetical protein